ncbi:MAG TPA: DUF1540 domain-containing protein [Clostridia bacterium]|nr:DUF1540 domain-containing protein [Clostridia bacterium]
MKGKSPNPHIGCSVNQCKYHCKDKQHCSLDKIAVGKLEENPHDKKATDCESFEKEF